MMKFILVFLVGTVIGIFTGVIATQFPNWTDFVWWMGGATCMRVTTAIMKQKDPK